MRVLIVEDSATLVAYLEDVLGRRDDVVLLETARDGRTAVERALAERPDVVLMDLNLPRLDGVSAIREILQTRPMPIVVLSSEVGNRATDRTYEAFDAGAVDVLPKPRGLGAQPLASFERRLVRTLEVMREARVVVRKRRPASAPPVVAGYEAVLIGSSTGGPQLLRQLLDAIPAPFPIPIVIAQHVYPGFEDGLARWLSGTGHRARVVAGDAALEPGVLIAPADCDLIVASRIRVSAVPSPGTGVRPSVDRLLRTGAERLGAHAVGVVLTGMGRDGSEGLLAVRHAGGLTVTQRGDTCVVDGMPRAARELGASTWDLAPAAIAELLKGLGASEEGRR